MRIIFRKVREWIKTHKVVASVIAGILLVIGVPVLIHTFFKMGAPCEWLVADWESGDILGYYGVILGVGGAALGIYATIRHEQKKYSEDIIRQSLPYFILTTLRVNLNFSPFARPAGADNPVAVGSTNHYEEYPLDRIYYVIKNGEIKAKSKLTESEQSYIERGGFEWERKGNTLTSAFRKYISLPFEIENAGNGASALTKIGFNLRSAAKKNYVNAKPVKVGQKMYIHILCEDVQQCDIGVYEFEVYYLDIFMNAYIQRYTITIEDRGPEAAISIEMYAKQKKTELPDKPAVK